MDTYAQWKSQVSVGNSLIRRFKDAISGNCCSY